MRRSVSFALGAALPEPDRAPLVLDARLERHPRAARLLTDVDLADLLVLAQLLLVRGDLMGAQLPRVRAEEQLQQREVPQLGDLVGRLGPPAVQRGASLRRQRVALAPPAALLALLAQQ